MAEEEEEIERISILPQRRQDEINLILSETQIQPMNIMDALIEYDESILPLDVCQKLL